ncbi:MAG: PorV/PorQ family protein, partial [Ignavibacteriales bacterium]|nr:PorV/PorQ family protein [Ignavibacteriales bacterium]
MRPQLLRITGVLLALILSLTIVAEAQQVTKVGTTAAKFLSIPVGARALGMGGAFVGVANDASAMYWNPGGLAGLPQSEAIFSHATWLADMRFNFAAVALPLRDFGTFGVHFTSLTMDEMERTTEDFPEGTGQMFSAGSVALGVTYARQLTDWFFIGANVKYVNEYIWNSSATGFAIDLGTLFTTPFPGVKFGAVISNFGQKLRIAGDDLLVQKDISPNQGNNPNINANLTTDFFELPLTLRIGLAYDLISSDDQKLVLAVDAAHPNDNSESINVGAEYSLFGNMLALRGGYKAYGARDSEEKATFGGGLMYEVTPGV